MPYSALPAARRRHYEIDGSVVGFNIGGGLGTGMTSIMSAANMLAMNEESPTVQSQVITVSQNPLNFYLLFPELVDLSFFILRTNSAGNTATLANFAGSSDTTNGADGTWTNFGTGAGTISIPASSSDWWRSTSPISLTSNNTGIKGLRFSTSNVQTTYGVLNVYVWGTKHSGETPNDIIFLESDGTTEWPNDDDWGDVAAGSGATVHTYYVKNTSSLTAHSITVKSSGSDSAQWTVSLDNVSFGSSQSIASLAPGTTQVVYFKFTPPAAAGGNLRPYAGYIEADVASWS